MRRLFAVEGLACAGCARGLQRQLDLLPGMTQARVHYLTASALIDWDERVLDRSAIADRVRAAGYRLIDRHRPEDLAASLEVQGRRMAVRLFIAATAGMWAMALSLVLYLTDPPAGTAWWLALGAGVLTLPVLWAGRGILWMGWKSLRLRAPTMDLLVSTGALGAVALSALALAQGRSQVWFDAAAMLVTLLLLGRLIDLHTRRQALSALIAMARAAPETATLVTESGHRSVEAAAVGAGQRVIVDAGEAVTVDGVVTAGHSLLNRAVLTGESRPVAVGPGDRVSAGSINLDSRLTLVADRQGGDRDIDRMGGAIAMEIARGGAETGMADRWAARLAWGIPLLALLALGGSLIRGAETQPALVTALTILAGACPCALALAVPLVRLRAAAIAAGRDLRIREPEAFERLATLSDLVLDKTGTLTEGRPVLAAVLPEPGITPAEVLEAAALAETGLSHPLARAVTAVTGEIGPGGRRADRHAEGRDAGGRRVRVAAAPGEDHGTMLAVTRDGRMLGRLRFEDRPLAQAPTVLAILGRMGLRLHLASGDATGPTMRLGTALGLPPGRIAANQTPADKAALVRGLGPRAGLVGDGVNDAPAMAASACGIAVAAAHPAARMTADLVIERGGIDRLPEIVALARQARRIGQQNLALAVAYNAALLPLIVLGRMGPGLAALAMAASSLSVMANAARLRAPRLRAVSDGQAATGRPAPERPGPA